MNEAALRDEICRVGASLYARGYVHATAGNISVRIDGGFLITPTDACLGDARARRAWPTSTPTARQPAATAPSKTLALHRAHLRRRARRALRDPHPLARTWSR